jgi:protein-tyrosine phosphatase
VAERAAVPYDVPGLRQHALSIEPSVSQRMGDLAASGEALTAPRMVELMEDLYRRLVTDESGRFAEFFGHLLDEDTPLVFHCTAGKDRTGVAAALLLLALGVPQAVVEQDYLLTNAIYRRPHTPDSVLPPEAQAVLWGVRPSFLQVALQAMDEHRGGREGFLSQRMGLTVAARDRLRALYLDV